MHFLHQQVNVFLIGQRIQAFDNILGHITHRKGGQIQDVFSLLQPHQGQKVADNAVHSVNLTVDVLQKVLIQLFGHAVLQQQGFREHLDGTEGGLQLMGNVGNEFLSRAVETEKIMGHVFDLIHNRRELIFRLETGPAQVLHVDFLIFEVPEPDYDLLQWSH